VEALRLILRYVHLIGFGLLLGGTVVQYLTGKLRINPAMLWGSVIQVVTGLALAAPWPDRADPPAAKLAVKLVLAIMIFVMVFFARRREQVNRGHFLATLGMVFVTGAVATLWN
jgi:hypothetical protein